MKISKIIYRLLIAFIIIVGLGHEAWAGGRWLGYPVLGFAIEEPLNYNGAHFCKDMGDKVSMPYVRWPLYTNGGLSFQLNANHKSCWNGPDLNSYDAVGLSFELDTEELFR